MKQDIRFKGLQLSADEQSVDNGALAICDGMEIRNNSLRPCVIEGNIVGYIPGEILYIHDINSSTKNAIYANSEGELYYKQIHVTPEAEAKSLVTTADFTRSEINGVTSIGNTVVIMTTKGLRYFRWKENAYKYLGEMPPEIQLEFQLQASSTMMHDIIQNDEGELDKDNTFVIKEYKYKRDSGPIIGPFIGSWLEEQDTPYPVMQLVVQYNSEKNIEAPLDPISKSSIVGTYYREEVDSSVDYEKASCLSTRENAADAALGRTATAIKRANQFYLPFYIRYCYRLWDGRKIMHSAPMLMFTEISYPESVLIYKNSDYSNSNYSHVAILFPAKLKYRCTNVSDLTLLKTDWKDVVKSIDVYITPGISRYDESYDTTFNVGNESTGTLSSYKWEAKWHRLNMTGDEQEKSILDFAPSTGTTTTNTLQQILSGAKADKIFNGTIVSHMQSLADDFLKQWNDACAELGSELTLDYYNLYFNINTDISINTDKKSYGLFIPQPLSAADWMKRLVENSSYYLLKRFDLKKTDSLPSSMTDFPIDSNTLTNLEAREQMISTTSPDDYRTHNSIIAETSFVYNNRINLAGISEIPFKGFTLNTMLPIVSETLLTNTSNNANDTIKTAGKIIVRLDSDYESVYVTRNFSGDKNSLWLIQNGFVFYPDTRAKEMWILDTDNNVLADLDLEEHPLLNGAYHLGDILTVDSIENATLPIFDNSIITSDTILNSPTYIFTSASGNPFIFPAASRYSVGSGKVLAIAATTKALSQGQFGQFPLIAFTTDGIWALEISNTGSYSSVQPISREVITNPKGLLQLDQSVAFITKRAINQIMSSDVNSISDALQGPLRDLSTMLPNLPSTTEIGDLINAVQQSESLYDFVNSRLLFFLKNDEGYFTGNVLILCAHDTSWCFRSLGIGLIKGVYNSYPYPYIHYTNTGLSQLAEPYDNADKGSYNGLIVTRTIKAGGVRNAIRGFLQDYDIDISFDNDPIEKRPMLYMWGSNDNRTWHYIGKSNAREMRNLPGRIYKYFRLAVEFKNMKRNDLYHGVQLDMVERFKK